MLKHIFFLIGVLTGAFLVELFRRQALSRLAVFESQAVAKQNFHKVLEKSQKEYYDQLSIEEKIDFTVAMASDLYDDEGDDYEPQE